MFSTTLLRTWIAFNFFDCDVYATFCCFFFKKVYTHLSNDQWLLDEVWCAVKRSNRKQLIVHKFCKRNFGRCGISFDENAWFISPSNMLGNRINLNVSCNLLGIIHDLQHTICIKSTSLQLFLCVTFFFGSWNRTETYGLVEVSNLFMCSAQAIRMFVWLHGAPVISTHRNAFWIY